MNMKVYQPNPAFRPDNLNNRNTPPPNTGAVNEALDELYKGLQDPKNIEPKQNPRPVPSYLQPQPPIEKKPSTEPPPSTPPTNTEDTTKTPRRSNRQDVIRLTPPGTDLDEIFSQGNFPLTQQLVLIRTAKNLGLISNTPTKTDKVWTVINQAADHYKSEIYITKAPIVIGQGKDAITIPKGAEFIVFEGYPGLVVIEDPKSGLRVELGSRFRDSMKMRVGIRQEGTPGKSIELGFMDMMAFRENGDGSFGIDVWPIRKSRDHIREPLQI